MHPNNIQEKRDKVSIFLLTFFIVFSLLYFIVPSDDTDQNVGGPLSLPQSKITDTVNLLSYPYLPNRNFTPGDIMIESTKENICTSGYSASVRNVSNSTKKQVFDSYNIKGEFGSYEIDHLISLQLGGSNSIKNLWPQSYKLPDWHARKKDGLENRLHSLVCKGEITLEEAQKAISENWIEAYKKYMKKGQ